MTRHTEPIFSKELGDPDIQICQPYPDRIQGWTCSEVQKVLDGDRGEE